MLLVQIALGGLTSANFAASACQTLPDCHGSYWPGEDLSVALDLTRSHETGPTGLALGGAERAAIHKLHRLGAVLAALTILLAGGLGLRAGLGATAAAAVVLVIVEFSLGIAAIVTQLPVGVAVAHNWIAAILLLTLIRLLALCRNRQALL
jgi:cytochrome c oxidase assembly protein subunit 15